MKKRIVVHDIRSEGTRREHLQRERRYSERAAYRRGLIIFWLFVFGGLALAIYIATL